MRCNLFVDSCIIGLNPLLASAFKPLPFLHITLEVYRSISSSGSFLLTPLLIEIVLKTLAIKSQLSQPLLRSVHELPKANSTLGSYRKLLRFSTRLSQPMAWIIPLFMKLGYEKHRERGVEQLPSQSIGTLPILP